MNRSHVLLAAVLIPAAVAVGAAFRSAKPVEAPFAGTPEVIAASFVSDWCGACKILEPKLSKVIPAFAEAPVKFVSLDFTFGNRPELAQRAAADGYSVVYARFAGATGFTLLIDAKSGEIIDRLTIIDSERSMRERINRALAQAVAEDGSTAGR